MEALESVIFKFWSILPPYEMRMLQGSNSGPLAPFLFQHGSQAHQTSTRFGKAFQVRDLKPRFHFAGAQLGTECEALL